MTVEKEKEYLSEKILRKIIAFIVVIAFIVPFMAPGVFAASSVSISGGDNVEGGDTFSVAVTFGGGDVGRVDAQLLYDTDQLTYISGGTSSGNTGYIQLKSAGTEGAIVFNVKFQAVSEGTATLQVTTNEMYDLEERSMDTPSTSKSITIQGSAAEEELITEPADEEQPEESSALMGVDELEEETGVNNMIPFIAAGFVLLVLIIVIVVVLTRKGRKKKNSGPARAPYRETYEDEPRIGRSGKPLDYRDTVRRSANEDTEYYSDWHINDDDYKDIDKW